MSAKRKAVSRLEQVDTVVEMRDDEEPNEMESPRWTAPLDKAMPPVGKMGGDTSRASGLRAEETPHEEETLRAEETPHEEETPHAEETLRAEETPHAEEPLRTKETLRVRVPPPVKEALLHDEDVAREEAPETPSTRPHPRAAPDARGFGWVVRLVLSILGVAAVVTLVVVALAAAEGRIVLPQSGRGPSRVDLGSGQLQGADLQGTNLYQVDLGGANLSEANLRGANAQHANLRQAILTRADLHYALLNDTDLREADLRGANMQWADLEHADLRGAQFEGANVKYARLDGALLPDGSQWTVSTDMRRFTDPAYADFWRP